MDNGDIISFGIGYVYEGKNINSYLNEDLLKKYNEAKDTGKTVSSLNYSDGKLYCFSPVRIPETDINWVFWTEIPIEGMMKEVNTSMSVMIFISIISILSFYWWLVLVSGQIRPIRILTENIEGSQTQILPLQSPLICESVRMRSVNWLLLQKKCSSR